MENYLKSELGGETAVPDLVQSLTTSTETTEESLHTASENLVTSAIISVDDLDSGDFNNVQPEVPSSEESPPTSSGISHTNTEIIKNDNINTGIIKADINNTDIIKTDINNTGIKTDINNSDIIKTDINNSSIKTDISNTDNSSTANNSTDITNTSTTLPTIQISPESSEDAAVPSHVPATANLQVQTDLAEEKAGDVRLCPSPSRIPSRKNSSANSQAINDDLRKLETRLEKFVNRSSEGSECSETSDNSGARSSASVSSRPYSSDCTVSSRLYSSATASSRAKTADKSQSSSSGNTSPQEKTSTMLKNTLRKMTRFSMGSRKETSEQQTGGTNTSSDMSEPKSRSRNPFIGKSRVPKSQSPASSGIARSKSFKEPGPPVSRNGAGSSGSSGYNGNTGRNNVYTSSMRRTKIKQQNNEEREERDSSSRAGKTSYKMINN